MATPTCVNPVSTTAPGREFGARELRWQRVGVEHDRLVLGIEDRLQLGLLERHPCVARQRQHHQDRVDFVRYVEQVDALLQAAAVHALRGDVDRVARRTVGRQQFADLRLDRFRQFRHLQALHRNRVRAPDAGAARHREHGDAIAFRHRISREHSGNGHGLIEIVGDDKTVFREHRVIGRRPAGHAGGMRGGGALAGAGAADLGHDDRLAGLGGAARGGEKFLDVADTFDEQQDHVGGRILHHIFEEFAGAEIGFVAGADDVAERDAERPRAVIDSKADAAALRDNADPPPGRDQPRLIGFDIDGRAEGSGDALDFAVKSFRIGTGNPHLGRFRKLRDGVLHRGAVAAFFRKS